MNSALRATAILGGSSIVTILVGFVSAKGWALMLGADGLGYLGLLQSLVGLVVLIAGFGIGPGLVRSGAMAIAQKDFGRVVVLRRAAWILFAVAGSVACVVLLLFREPIGRVMLGDRTRGTDVALMSIAVLLSLATGIQSSTLNAYHRVNALAKIGAINSVCSSGIALGIVRVWGDRAIAPAVVAMMAANWAISRFFLQREIEEDRHSVATAHLRSEATALLRFGGPYTASQLVGTGVQLLLPVVILHALSKEDVGFYRAAMAISVTYIGFLLTAMAQDYYPRVSAASAQPNELVDLANQQQRLVMMLGAPIVIGMLALAPYIVPIFYSGEFKPSVTILEWQLIGDLFKLSSWSMSFVILARSGSRPYFIIELVGGSTLLAFTWIGMEWFHLGGLGTGFLASYAAYWGVVWMVARRELALSWTRENWGLFLGYLAAALLIRGLPVLGLDAYRPMIAITMAFLVGINSVRMLSQDIGGIALIWNRYVRSPSTSDT